MIWGDVVLGARHWLAPASMLVVAAVAVLVWTYVRTRAELWVRLTASAAKTIAVLLIGICLLEPLYTGSRPRPGSNLFLVVADNSRSMGLVDERGGRSRGEQIRRELDESASWLARLGQEFDLRRYLFDTTLHPAKDFAALKFDGEASALTGTLDSLAQRFQGHPTAGILLLTDGNATDLTESPADWRQLPPIYPVVLGKESGLVDISVAQVSVSQTNFEAAPVTLVAEIDARGIGDKPIVVRVLDEKGTEVARQTTRADAEHPRVAQRFLLKPERPGISFFQVRAHLAGEESLEEDSTASAEATLANNRRYATVDRGGGPYRVLYVGGAPNWEFKFLRRALSTDEELNLVGLVRIARKEPKFTFLGRSGERTNPLFRGFGNNEDDKAEQYNEPVLLRLSTQDKEELRGGFPKQAEDLYRYHAIVLDEMEAAFFTQDQLSLLQQFVSQRGGGLLMLGGKASFQEGGYARTPVGEMLPIYLDRADTAAGVPEGYRLRLTREGWLQPWLRLQATEQEEQQRLASMPNFRSLNRIDSIKPGASILADVEATDGKVKPAFVAQAFGRGRVGALLVGDLWRWHMRRPEGAPSDLEKAWRQLVRWLVAEVPQAVEVEVARVAGPGLAPVDLVVRARDKQFTPLDNARVAITVTTPDDRKIELIAESADDKAGTYRVRFTPRVAGPYRARVTVTAADSSSVGQREAGWAVEPATDEFRTLPANVALLRRLAEETGGEVITLDGLNDFVRSLPNRKVPIIESWTYPIWHQWSVLAVACLCLVGEWGLRRWRGLP